MHPYYFAIGLIMLIFQSSGYCYRLPAITKFDYIETIETKEIILFNYKNSFFDCKKSPRVRRNVYYQNRNHGDIIVMNFNKRNAYTSIEKCMNEYEPDIVSIKIKSIPDKIFLAGDKYFSAEHSIIKLRNCQYIVAAYNNYFESDVIDCLKNFVMEYVHIGPNDYFYVRPSWKFTDCSL